MGTFPPVAGPVTPTPTSAEDALTLEQIENLKNLPDQFKKGYKTTEFWGSAALATIPVAAFVAKIFGVDIDAAELSVAATGVLPYIGYVFSRSWLKTKRVKAMSGSIY